jgi:hypothetical protein
VFDGLLRNAYPGQPEGTVVESDKNYWVPGAGSIKVDVGYDDLSVTNITSVDHIFYNGFVSRWVEQNGSDISVNTWGSGQNSWIFNAAENWAAGQLGFNASTDRIKLYVYYLGLGRNVPSARLPGP